MAFHWKILGRAPGTQRIETIDTFETRHEAMQMLAEYQMAFGPGWSLWVMS